MVKTELNYNPYLLETSVKFNGNEPKINSMVEKYISGRLEDWISTLPDIFYNEMNGWDFDVDFSGTKTDFESLQSAFNKADKGKGSVSLFHKNELESVEQKKQRIANLLSWFEGNRNRKFDYSSFLETNASLIDDKYSLIVVQGTLATTAIGDVVVENVNDVNELEHATLENTPILFFVTEKNCRLFRENIKAILKRNDIISEQLFFHIDSELGLLQMQRIIKELGVNNPQIVGDSIDPVLVKYFEVYPVTTYIQRIISALRIVQSSICDLLKKEGEQNITINSGIREKIDSLDAIISKLKNAAERIKQRDNFEPPDTFNAKANEFVARTTSWNKKKIKITSDEEAGSKAVEFQKDLGNFFAEFVKQITQEFHATSSSILQNFASIYASAEFGDDYKSNQDIQIDLSVYELPKIMQELMEFKEESMVEQSDFFGPIKNLFGSSKPEETKELKRVVEYKYDVWRKHAIQTASPVLDEVISAAVGILADYYDNVAEEYLEHLKMQIEQQTHTKDEVAAQLSDDERRFQEDVDWLDIFQEKLREIERG